jgi:parallel beta-helix repeat protein
VEPWATLQHAADVAGPGDSVIVRAGQYDGFEVTTVASQALPLVFRAAPGELVELVSDVPGRGVGVNLEGAEWVTIEGFRAENRAVAGFRAALCRHVTFRGNVARDNGRWGIFTGCCDDLLIEGNLASGSCEEHGIYVSNSGDRPVVRGNVVFGNNANGLHFNGDASNDCEASTDNDGVIEQALIEGNVIFDNGFGGCTPDNAGGSGINGDGLQDSVIRNNLIWNAHHSGISLYAIDAAQPAHGNRVLGNTIHTDDDAGKGRWAVNIQDGSQGTVLRDNFLWSDHGSRGAIAACATCLVGLDSDRNAVEDRFSVDGGGTGITLAQWRTATGQDGDSFVATAASLFVAPGGGDYHPAPASAALEAGTAHAELTEDLEGAPRPAGAAHDIGAFEGSGVIFRDAFESGAPVRWAAVLAGGPF